MTDGNRYFSTNGDDKVRVTGNVEVSLSQFSTTSGLSRGKGDLAPCILKFGTRQKL